MKISQSPQLMDKLKYAFDKHSINGTILQNKYIPRFLQTVGLYSAAFIKDLRLHLPTLTKGAPLSYDDFVNFLDFIFLNHNHQKVIGAFKIFDKNGSGTINSSELLAVLKKKLLKKEYETYEFMINSAFGPTIHYHTEFKCQKI